MSEPQVTIQGNERMESNIKHERQAINRIKEGLKDISDIRIFENFFIYNQLDKSYLQADLLVVHESFIYVVELKEWKGTITINNDFWMRDGMTWYDPHITNNEKCKIFKSVLSDSMKTKEKIPIVSK
jgi:hypothetical protein